MGETGTQIEVSHYEGALREDGWTVAVQEIPTEAPEGEPVDVRELTANRAGALFTIALETYSGRTTPRSAWRRSCCRYAEVCKMPGAAWEVDEMLVWAEKVRVLLGVKASTVDLHRVLAAVLFNFDRVGRALPSASS